MSNSPFEIFRRNLKPLMVLLTGLALFAFVILPVVDSYMRQNTGGGGNAVVAKFDGTSLTQNRVEYFTRNHNELVGFLVKLAEATLQRGGVPRTAGFQYDPRSQQIQRLGINENPNIEGSVRTLMFAAKAKEAGFELDDSAIQLWLERFTDGIISDSDITGLLMTTTQNRMGRPHLYEQLRNHLLADVYLKRGYAGLYSGDNPSAGALMTPAEQWSAFVRLNQSATIDAYGVLVSDYIDQTEEFPPEAIIQATYQEGQDRAPDDQSPEPAFRRRYQATFEYVVGNLDQFIDEEVAKLSEEEIRAEYDKQVAGGAFVLPEEGFDEMLEESDRESTEEAGTETSDADSESEPEMESSATEAEPSQPGETEPGETEPGDTEPGDTEPNSESGESPPESGKESETPATADGADGADAPEVPESPPADPPGQEPSARAVRTGAIRLVAVQDQGATEPTAGDPPAAESGEGEPADPEMETSPAESDEPAESQAADEPAPKVQPFEEVRDQVARRMVFSAAQERIQSAAREIARRMQEYLTDVAIHQSNLAAGTPGDPPQPPDLEQLAAANGFEYQKLGPHDRVSIAVDPIATSMDPETPFGGRGPNFTQMMYGFNQFQGEMEPREKFSPLITADLLAGNTYVSWKIDDREAHTPPLAEVREEVIRYIRMKQARMFAAAEAESIASRASQDGNALPELVPEGETENYYAGLGPFKWLDSMGFGVTIGNVPELDSVGEEFMEAVFQTEVDDYAVAPNRPQRVYYVVRPTKFEPSLDALRQQFREPINRRQLAAVNAGAGEVINDFFESVDQRSGYTSMFEEQP